jgi:hypothetical protein
MEIIRHEYPLRGEGVPIISRVVEHGETVYVCSTLPDPHTASICRHAPKVRAVCGKAARTVLCGGRDANRVPCTLRTA